MIHPVNDYPVWHVPAGQLGLYGQNINLPFMTTPVVSTDGDGQASEKMLEVGYGIILNGTDWYNQSW